MLSRLGRGLVHGHLRGVPHDLDVRLVRGLANDRIRFHFHFHLALDGSCCAVLDEIHHLDLPGLPGVISQFICSLYNGALSLGFLTC